MKDFPMLTTDIRIKPQEVLQDVWHNTRETSAWHIIINLLKNRKKILQVAYAIKFYFQRGKYKIDRCILNINKRSKKTKEWYLCSFGEKKQAVKETVKTLANQKSKNTQKYELSFTSNYILNKSLKSLDKNNANEIKIEKI